MMLQEHMSASLPVKPNRTYTFVSQPRAIIHSRKEFYRNNDIPGESSSFGNLMHDRRVFRGNTYSLHASSKKNNSLDIQGEKRKPRTRRLRRNHTFGNNKASTAESQLNADLRKSTKTDEQDAECQTEDWVSPDDASSSVNYMLANCGVDVATQIYDGDLFNFEDEIKPVAELLAGRIIEQAAIEVMEEEQLEHLRRQQERLRKLQELEVIELERLTSHKEQYLHEYRRKSEMQSSMFQLERETGKKLTARAFAQSLMSDLVPTVFSNLEKHGYINDPVTLDIEQGFIPWLMSRVSKRLEEVDVPKSPMSDGQDSPESNGSAIDDGPSVPSSSPSSPLLRSSDTVPTP